VEEYLGDALPNFLLVSVRMDGPLFYLRFFGVYLNDPDS
jgi:hypothetical protein